ncbi:hypothetical protein HAX54_007786 [Datura stramonium]|uniref:F-box associated domain-containing protein n=1 Tax=Datura stramonium TaxID=4076 RepID=A0ABS8RI30_DATST|nr:hypothetical protein [Datura stramonium]
MLPLPCPLEGFDTRPSAFLRSTNSIVDESVNFLDRRVYIVASFNSQSVNKQRIYYVYSPVMKWCLALPKTKICIKNPAVGFICKVRDLEKDVISFTIVCYSIPNLWGLYFTSITIESFSSETNMWTINFLKLDVPLGLCPSLHRETSSAGDIDGVFCWLGQQPQITVYYSVHKLCGLWNCLKRLWPETVVFLEYQVGNCTWY